MNTIRPELRRVDQAATGRARNKKAARKARFEEAVKAGRSLLHELLLYLRNDPEDVVEMLRDEQCSEEHYNLAALLANELSEMSGTHVPVRLHHSKRGVCGYHVLDLLRQIVDELAQQKTE